MFTRGHILQRNSPCVILLNKQIYHKYSAIDISQRYLKLNAGYPLIENTSNALILTSVLM